VVDPTLKLKPCPFCGSADVFETSDVFETGGSTSYVECSICGARGPKTLTPSFGKIEVAAVIRGWNWALRTGMSGADILRRAIEQERASLAAPLSPDDQQMLADVKQAVLGPRSATLPEDEQGIDELLDELAPEVAVTVFEVDGVPDPRGVAGRELRSPDGEVVTRIWRHSGRWWCLENVQDEGSAVVEELKSAEALAQVLARLLLLDVHPAEPALRERASLMKLELESRRDDEARERVLAEDAAQQATAEVVFSAGRAEPLREPPFDPIEQGYYLARLEDVGEVAEWGPLLNATPELEALLHDGVPTTKGWYVVRVDIPGGPHQSTRVAKWGARCFFPCTVDDVLEGFLVEGGDSDG
jgi:Lar family restriction alleviation protein